MRSRAASAAYGVAALSLGFGMMQIGIQRHAPAGHRESSQTILAASVPSASDRLLESLSLREAEQREAEHLESLAREEAERVANETREAEERESTRLVAVAAEKARKAAESVVVTPTTVRAAPVARTPAVSGGDSATWAALSQCESDNTNADTGNGYSGYLQFSDATWRSLGYSGRAVDHDYATQIQAGQELQARSGWGQWPACSRELGLR